MADKQTVKVGDKVRSKYSCHSGGYDIGDVFTVTKVDGEFIEFVDKDGSDRLRSSDEFDLLPVADATGKPVFKVGDRVRLIKDGLSTIGAAGKLATIEAWSDGTVVNDGQYLLNIDGPVDYVTRAVTPQYTRASPECFELLAPSLTIETGKFYRTRDGRKVGPMEIWNPAVEHPWQQQGGSAVFTAGGDIWRDDGSSEYGVPQLIAEWSEWVDEPLATASTDAASNDNAPVAKFKVGDIVKRSGSFMPHQRLRITKAVGDRYSVEWLEGGPGSIDNWRGYEFELAGPTSQPAIVALIENGQPKPSEQPKVHKSEESATDEAERLAVKYPGQKFGVFVLADSRIADVVIRRAA